MEAKLHKASEVKDEDKLYRYNGVLYPSIVCPEDHLKALDGFQAREDDMLLVAYPKCGFNWVVALMRKIITVSTGVKMDVKMPPLMEFFGPNALKDVVQAPSPRFLGTHLHPDIIPPSFYEKKTKMLVVFRNPKDTVVSYFHFSNNNPVLPDTTWDSFYSSFMAGDVAWGSYFEHVLAWEKKLNDPNVMLVTYEELKQDLRSSVRQISEFFSFSLTDDQVQQISDEGTFAAMKDSAAASHGVMKNVFFRKGEIGDWKNHFTAEQSQKMDEAFNKHLSGTRLGTKLNYDRYCQ
ncbi:sulfotransferase 6B1 [Thalassophryne amazonica]|uniref:sulfotransferase 6B1 n=1 Tax=Thalassophryne amazonica TaxID=390379 RepID=UPI0014718E1E|nr:sulfotransferase 6B1 [Thalassophryne amazonica]